MSLLTAFEAEIRVKATHLIKPGLKTGKKERNMEIKDIFTT